MLGISSLFIGITQAMVSASCWTFCPCLLTLLSLNPEVHPTLGEMVACASISLDLIVLSWIHTSAVLPAILAAVFGLQGF